MLLTTLGILTSKLINESLPIAASSTGFSVGDVTTSTVQVRWPNIVMEPGTNFYYKIQTTDPAGHTQSQNIQPVPNAGPDYVNNYVIPNLLPSTQYEVSLVVVSNNQEHIVGTQVPTTKSKNLRFKFLDMRS